MIPNRMSVISNNIQDIINYTSIILAPYLEKKEMNFLLTNIQLLFDDKIEEMRPVKLIEDNKLTQEDLYRYATNIYKYILPTARQKMVDFLKYGFQKFSNTSNKVIYSKLRDNNKNNPNKHIILYDSKETFLELLNTVK